MGKVLTKINSKHHQPERFMLNPESDFRIEFNQHPLNQTELIQSESSMGNLKPSGATDISLFMTGSNHPTITNSMRRALS